MNYLFTASLYSPIIICVWAIIYVLFCCCILSYPFYTLSVYLREVYLNNYILLSNYRLKIYTLLLSRPGHILIYSTIAIAVDGVSGTDCWEGGCEYFVDYESDAWVGNDQENLGSGAAHSLAQDSEHRSGNTQHTPGKEKLGGGPLETSTPLKPKTKTLETPNLEPQENKPGRSHFKDTDTTPLSSGGFKNVGNDTQSIKESTIVHSTDTPIKVITPSGAIGYIPLKSTISTALHTDIGLQSNRFNYPPVHQIPLIPNQAGHANPNIHSLILNWPTLPQRDIENFTRFYNFTTYVIPITVCVRIGIVLIAIFVPIISERFFS